jgi:hypothetical protein
VAHDDKSTSALQVGQQLLQHFGHRRQAHHVGLRTAGKAVAGQINGKHIGKLSQRID